MKKFAVLTVLLSLSLSLMAPVMAQTRPRRAPDTTPGTTTTTTQTQSTQQTTQQPDSGYYDPNNQRPTTAPVLKGSDGRPVTSPPTSSTGTPDPATQSTAPNDPQEVDEDEVIKVDTALVSLPVSVTDRDGKYIPNLKQRDFKIYEDGVEQDVAYFAPTEKPFTVALVMDMSGSTKNHLGEIQDAAITFVDQLRRDDKVIVISFDDDVHVLAEATSDRRRLRSAIQSSRPGEGTSLYEAVDFVLNQRLKRIDGRKAIVLFTDGVDTSSRKATYQSNVLDAEEDGSLVYVLQYDTFQDMNVSSGGGNYPAPKQRPTLIDAIGAILSGGSANVYGQRRRSGGGVGTSEEDYRRADSYLHSIADRTGARVERADTIQDLDKSFGIIAEELRRQYSLGYYPKASSVAGTRHAVRVRVLKPNLAVKARNNYITGEQTGPKTGPQRLAGTAGQVR
ncbi:MAG: VWA domain-containing protein [Pyrinomonadaceae bacterium]